MEHPGNWHAVRLATFALNAQNLTQRLSAAKPQPKLLGASAQKIFSRMHDVGL